MERMLARLERRFGGIAIPNLTAVVVAGMGAVFVMSKMRPEAVGRLYLDFDAVRRGELWRLVTYLFLPNTSSAYFILFSLLFVWSVGSTLENHWGAFRYNLFYVLGCLGTTVAAWLTGHAETNFWLSLSLMLAFGTLFPDVEFSFYFPFPIKAKWFALVDAAYVAYSLATGDVSTRAAILAALSGYFILCGSSLNAMLRGRNLQVRQAARRTSLAPTPSSASGARTCAICGASETDGADIRVCSCAKCGEPRTLCLVHARSH